MSKTNFPQAAIAALRSVPYLRALSEAEFERLLRGCQVRTFEPGARAFTEGEAPPGMFLILSGRIKVVRSGLDGREQVLHEEGPGATLAEVPVFDGEGCVGTAIALEPSTLALVPTELLLAALALNPAAATAVIKLLAARTRRFAALIEDLSLRAISERLAKYLLRECERGRTSTIRLPPTREQLAAHVGTVREEVSRALSQLKRERMIEVDDRIVRVLSMDRLRAASDRQ